MCLAIPAQLVEVIEPGLANAEVSGVRREFSTVLVPEAQVGDWVLVHVGFALHTIDEEEAARTLALLEEIDLVRRRPAAPAGTSPSRHASSKSRATRRSSRSKGARESVAIEFVAPVAHGDVLPLPRRNRDQKDGALKYVDEYRYGARAASR